ncbi:MAG: 50S ribosomal protein L32e [Candidatus Hodarchaeales archaeon]
MSSNKELKRLIKLKKKIKKKNPVFQRSESWRYKRVKGGWRHPIGIDNKMKEKNKGWPALVSVGYGTPANLRHKHASGREEVLVYNVNDLDLINPEDQVIRIGKIGRRKKKEIIDQADIFGIKVLNRIPGVGEVEMEEYEEETGVGVEGLEEVDLEDLSSDDEEEDEEIASPEDD